MAMNFQNNFFYILLLIPFFSFAQDFKYKVELNAINNNWQQINLNTEILSKVKSDFSDIRIYEYGNSNDTIEVPYLIKSLRNTLLERGINFKLLNQVVKDNDLYLTFETINHIEINEIELRLNEDNYNYNIDLEGSLEQKEWFQLVKNYRILSIINKETDYQFSKILFPLSNYKYYRIRVKDAHKSNLKSAVIKQKTIIPGEYLSYESTLYQEEKNKKSIITLDLGELLHISECNIDILSDADFYRPISIKYLADSTKTNKGWNYNYIHIYRGDISSLESNLFEFPSIFTNKLQIEISNNDNQALKIKNIEIKGPKYKLIARFADKKAKSYMLFGNPEINHPNYDLSNFEMNIPSALNTLEIGEITDLKPPKVRSSFLNSGFWFWLILSFTMTLLAYFSYDMLKKKTAK